MSTNFSPELHTFRSERLRSVVESVIKDAISFFNNTPVHPLPPPDRFVGAGVYALYYFGSFKLYERLAALNAGAARSPIYIGKAVPPGSRTGFEVTRNETRDLFDRLRQHKRSIEQGEGLSITDFRCRFMLFGDVEADLIAPVESALIRKYRSLWNAAILHGFGNHDPGKGRYNQRRSRWDILHPGRPWAFRMVNLAASQEEIIADVKRFIDESSLS
jgi:hypothetical protein